VWWFTPVIPALRRQKQKNQGQPGILSEFNLRKKKNEIKEKKRREKSTLGGFKG
jgi:hypothetical protein